MNLTVTSFCTFLLTHRSLTPRRPTPGSPASPSLESVLEENEESSTGLTEQAGESEAIPEDGDGKEAHLLENKEDPQNVSVQSMSDFCNKQPTEEFPGKPKASPATGCHESGWGHAPWVRWLCIAVWHPSSGSHPHVLSVLHPQVQSVVHHVHSQLTPTSTVHPAWHTQSTYTHKYSPSCMTYTVSLHPQVQSVLHDIHSQLTPTSTVRPSWHTQSTYTHKCNLSGMYTVRNIQLAYIHKCSLSCIMYSCLMHTSTVCLVSCTVGLHTQVQSARQTVHSMHLHPHKYTQSSKTCCQLTTNTKIMRNAKDLFIWITTESKQCLVQHVGL